MPFGARRALFLFEDAMPFEIRKTGPDDKPFCVFTKGEGGRNHGCHATEAQAKKQLAALYVNVPEAKMSEFSLATFATEGDSVVKSGLIFRAGDYPDKAYAMTAAELAAAAASFQPLPIGDTHLDSIFDGKLGTLEEVWPDGEELHGKVRLPGWFAGVLGEEPLKVSCEWDRQTKALAGLVVVPNPRVSDAALMSAYATFAARHDTPHGQTAIQEIHDASARHGAVCKSTNTAAQMASTHESKAIQAVHDTTTEHGAVCASGKRPAWATYAADKPLDYVAGGSYSWQGVTPWTNAADTALRGKFMNAWEWLKERLSGEEPPAGTSATPKPAPAEFAEDPRIAALEAQVAAERAARLSVEANAWADGEIAACRATPAEKAGMVASFTRAADDDAASPAKVNFADGKEGTRLDALRALFSARTAHDLAAELLDPKLDAAKFAEVLAAVRESPRAAGEDAPPTAEELDKLHALTPMGQALLADRQKALTNGNGGR